MGKRILHLSVGDSHALAATEDEIYGWGLNDRGQITPNESSSPNQHNVQQQQQQQHPDLDGSVVVLPVLLGKVGSKVIQKRNK